MAKSEKQQQAEKRLKWAMKQMDGVEVSPSLLADIVGKATDKLDSQADEPELIKLGDIKDKIEREAEYYGQMHPDAISTGLKILDRMIGGLKPGEVSLVCADPNVGKSWLCSDIAVLASSQVPTLFITLEMRAEQLGARMMIHAKKVGADDNWTDGLDMYFQKVKTLDYRNVKKIFSIAAANDIKCVFLDYLQYLGVGMKPEEMAKISRMFHELALVYNIPIMIVASLRKGASGTRRKWHEIEQEDISGSAGIAYDADNIITVGRTNPSENTYNPNEIWIKHLKSRNMPRDYDFPFGLLSWDGGSITDHEEWWNHTGRFYPNTNDRAVKVERK